MPQAIPMIAARLAPMLGGEAAAAGGTQAAAGGGAAGGGGAGRMLGQVASTGGGGGGGMPGGNPMTTVQSIPGIKQAKQMFGQAMAAGQMAESRAGNVASYLNPSQFR